MKKVLVTGAGGFIGSHLAEKLLEKGYHVKAFLHYNSKNNWGWLEYSKYKNEFEIITGDIRDYDSVYSAVKGSEIVFHLAALIGIPYSYISPLAYIKTNVEGTYNILQACKECNIEKILHTSTSEVYGSAIYTPIDENHPLQGQSPYSASKIGADQLAFSYFTSFNLPVIIVRPFNTFGPRQSARAIIPTIITQILNNKDFIKVGNLSPSRDLNYVLDTVNGFIKIAEESKNYGETINIGRGEDITIGELIKKIMKIMGKNLEIISEEKRIRPEKSEVTKLLCSNKKIMELTSWKIEYSLEDGLYETIEWFKNNSHYYKSDIYNY